MATKTQSKGKGKAGAVGQIKYPVYHSEDFVGPNAMTAKKVMEMLDWTVVDGEGDYQFTDMLGNKVNCKNNTKNRPFDRGHALGLAQKVLHKHWAGPNGLGKTPNGESWSIGVSGQFLSAQHRAIGLVFAWQIWNYEGDDAEMQAKAEHFHEIWDTEPVMDCTITFGVSEDADTMATLDNVKPRSFADTLYCDPDTFPKLKGKDRQKACRMADTGVRELWNRTGEKNDPFSPKRTHQEAWMWLKNHNQFKESLSFMFNNDGDGQVSGQTSHIKIPAGTAAALHYLMASAATEPEKYFANDPRMEGSGKTKYIDFSLAEKADEFWVSLISNNPAYKGVRFALASPFGENYQGMFGIQDRIHVLVHGFNQFKIGGRLTKRDAFEVMYDEDGGVRTSAEFPELGGIDKGAATKEKPVKEKDDDEEEEDVDNESEDVDDDDDEEETPKKKVAKKKAPAKKPSTKASKNGDKEEDDDEEEDVPVDEDEDEDVEDEEDVEEDEESDDEDYE